MSNGSKFLCPICGEQYMSDIECEFPISLTSDRRYYKKPISHILCRRCGYICVAPEKRLKVDIFYRFEYSFNLEDEYIEPVLDNERYSEVSANFFEGYLYDDPNRSFIDIGAGKGLFLGAIHKRFPKIRKFALEPSSAYNILKDKPFLCKSYNTLFKPDIFGKMTFDYISLVGVLEHVEDPKQFLSDICLIMHSDSILFVEVPNFKVNKTDLMVIDHISKFTEESIENLFGILGFEILRKEVSYQTVPMRYLLMKGNNMNSKFQNNHIEKLINDALYFISKQIDDAKKIKTQSNRFLVYGQGLILDYLIFSGLWSIENIEFIIDDNQLYHGKKYRNKVDIISFDDLLNRNLSLPIFLAMNDCYHNKVLSKFSGKIELNKIFGAIS